MLCVRERENWREKRFRRIFESLNFGGNGVEVVLLGILKERRKGEKEEKKPDVSKRDRGEKECWEEEG